MSYEVKAVPDKYLEVATAVANYLLPSANTHTGSEVKVGIENYERTEKGRFCIRYEAAFKMCRCEGRLCWKHVSTKRVYNMTLDVPIS